MYKTICYESLGGLNYNFEVEKIFELNSTEFKFYLKNVENTKTSIISKNKKDEIELKTNDLVNVNKSLLYSKLCSYTWN